MWFFDFLAFWANVWWMIIQGVLYLLAILALIVFGYLGLSVAAGGRRDGTR